MDRLRQVSIVLKKYIFSNNQIYCYFHRSRFVWVLFILHLSPFNSSSLLFAQLVNSSWPMYMHDIRHTGQSKVSGPNKNTLYWQYQTGSDIVASPSVGADGTIYFGDVTGKFYALEPMGKTKWVYTTGGEISASAAIDSHGVIYIGSKDTYLYALQKDGTLKWRYKTSGGISSSPVIHPENGNLYFGGEDKYLYALDRNGNLLWKARLDEEIWTSPALDKNNGTLYVGSYGGTVYAIDVNNGTEKWAFEAEDTITGSPSLDEKNEVVLVGFTSGEIYALNKSDGSPQWTYTAGGEITSTPAIDTTKNADVAYVCSEDGNLYALKRTTGALQWQYKTNGAITSSPAIDNEGRIYFGSADNNIYSLNKTGTLKWKYSTQGGIHSSPAIGSNGLIYIGSSDGNLYALGLKSATVLAASFTGTSTSGELPLTVQFTDTSTGSVSDRQWDFGDGTIDSANTPVTTHTYNTAGNFTVSLTVTDIYGLSDTETKENYITVTRKPSDIALDSISPSEITFGESLTIAGHIDPAHQSQVTLTFTNDNGETGTETVTSGSDGSFTLVDYFPTGGGSWDVVAGWEGDSDHSDATSNSQTFTVNQAKMTISVESSSSAILVDQTVDISGIVTLTPDNETTRNEFLNENVKLIRINPDGRYEGVIEVQPFLLNDQIHYKFEAVKLPALGTWKLLVGFEENESFAGVNSETVEIEVYEVPEGVAGYAILIEGRIKGKSSLDSYNLTMNDIYEKLIDRGFSEDNIYYFNYDDSQESVYGKPDKDEILSAITEMADSMNESPAPLYIILVGYGDKKNFFIYPDTLTSSDMAEALNSLESQLNSDASEKPIVVVSGANRSGSFINALSQSGTKRVIITSSDTEEVSYKGPLPPDETIRHADYFVKEFFTYAARGLSLKKCYEKASDKVSVFTKNENGNGLNGASAGNGQYFDDSAQHPLLDDNGDGVGTYGALSSLTGNDGEISADTVLGIGTTTTALELTEVAEVITLKKDGETPTLYAKVNDTTMVDEAWIEIVSPNFSLKNDKEVTEQQVISLPRFSYDEFDTAEEEYVWNDFSSKGFNNFGKTGAYQIFYFARDDFGEISPFMESVVFKNAEGNKPPKSFNLISPENGAETAVALIFDWEDSADPDKKTTSPDGGKKTKTASQNKGITYTFMISQSSSFDTLQHQQKGLTDSIVVVDKTAGLINGNTYYWKVLASDSKGGSTYAGSSSSFKPRLANGYPGFVKGFIFNNATNAKIGNATITVEGAKGSYTTTTSGAYFLELSSGTYTFSVKATGYETGTKTVAVAALSTTTQHIGLTVAAKNSSISGTVKDKKSNPLKGVKITIKKKSFTKTATTGSNGGYSFTELKPGKYTVAAKLKGYKSFKKSITLASRQDKKVNIRLKTKK